MRYRTGNDASTGSKYISAPGRYHVIVADIQEAPEAEVMFKVSMGVLAGTVESQIDHELNEKFRYPDGNDMKRRKADRFLIATNLIRPADVNEQDLDIDILRAKGQQLFVEVEANDYQGKTYHRISFANIYHVDDPDVATWPRDDEMIKTIPSQWRWKPGDGIQEPAKRPPVDMSDEIPF